jgi:hypothetical protein
MKGAENHVNWVSNSHKALVKRLRLIGLGVSPMNTIYPGMGSQM